MSISVIEKEIEQCESCGANHCECVEYEDDETGHISITWKCSVCGSEDFDTYTSEEDINGYWQTKQNPFAGCFPF